MTRIMSQPFPMQTEPAIASYDYTDLVNGLGYEIFYLHTTYDSAVAYNLQPQVIYSASPDLGGAATIDSVQGPAGTTTRTFDSSVFNSQRTVKGTAYLVLGGEMILSKDDNYVKGQLYKYDGTTATAISSQITKTVLATAPAEGQIWVLKIPCTETIIKKGEQLRLVVQIVVSATAGGGEYIAFGHDPMNRDGTYVTPSTDADTITSSRVHVPFKIIT